MNWEAIGAFGEVGGAIAVVVTLIYLGRQISLSQQATTAATHHSLTESLNQAYGIFTDESMMLMQLKIADTGWGSLSRSEQARYIIFTEKSLVHCCLQLLNLEETFAGLIGCKCGSENKPSSNSIFPFGFFGFSSQSWGYYCGF